MSINFDACPKLAKLGIASNAQQKGLDECLGCEYPMCYHDMAYRQRSRIAYGLPKRGRPESKQGVR